LVVGVRRFSDFDFDFGNVVRFVGAVRGCRMNARLATLRVTFRFDRPFFFRLKQVCIGRAARGELLEDDHGISPSYLHHKRNQQSVALFADSWSRHNIKANTPQANKPSCS
jgi:hypothetical protein